MICDNRAAQTWALFLHSFLYFKNFFCLNSMFYSYILYVSYPLVNGVGCGKRKWIFVQLAQIRIYIAIVEYRVTLLPLAWVASIIDHQHAVIHRWNGH